MFYALSIIHIIYEKGIRFLQKALNEEFDNHQTCFGKSQQSKIARLHLIIETERSDQKLTVLFVYPVELCVTCNRYILFIIAYQENNDITSVGHYIAYIKTGRKWLYYDNNLHKGKSGIVDE